MDIKESRCVQVFFFKKFVTNFKFLIFLEDDPGDEDNFENVGEAGQGFSTNFNMHKLENVTKDCGKCKPLPKIGNDIDIDQLTFNLKERISKYHFLIDNDPALNSIHNLLQSQLGILNKVLETQFKEILKSHTNHCNLLASVILHNYSSEMSFPTISPSKKKS